MAKVVEFSVNGLPVRVTDEVETLTLLDFLRDTLGLTGSKNGCGEGHCGACTVIVNGEARRACLLRVQKLAGARVETIEGLSHAGQLHPAQAAFVREGAVQCGFCTPGMVMATKALLDHNPDPTDADIRVALQHNLCRCTGYTAILRAVRAAAASLQAGQGATVLEEATCSDVVGQSVLRKDAIGKVTGSLRFAGDLPAEGLLIAKALRSEYPHAQVLAVHTQDAAAVPGVVAVLTAKDIPGRNAFGLIRIDAPVLASDRVRYVGDAIACVYAESATAADEALRLIRVEYQPLEVVATPQRALESDAPQLHDGGNVLVEFHVQKGDVAAGFAEADVVLENDYLTPFVEHAYLEPESCLAMPDGSGGVSVSVGSQGPYVDRQQIAASLALPDDKVRVIHTPMGGGFGGKEDITVQILAALGAVRLKRPVRMVLTRPESIKVSPKRHAEYLHYKTGVMRDGRLVAVEARIIGDTGAYASAGQAVLLRSAAFACGPYQVPNVKVDSYGVYTNNPPAGAMRGYGSPQVAFAAESQMDELARRLGMDPFEFRLKNALEVGSVTATGHRLTESVGIKDTLVAVREALGREEVREPGPGKRIGIGIASAYKNVGLGPGVVDRAGAIVELERTGRVVMRGGCIDMGQGQNTVMAQMAAQVLGVPYAKVDVITGDTAVCPDSFMTTASRATMLQGNAVTMAAARLREAILDLASREFHLDRETTRLQMGLVVDIASGRRVPLVEVASRAAQMGALLLAEAQYTAPEAYRNLIVDEALLMADPEKYRLHVAYCYSTQAAIVEVDEATGEVRPLKIIAAQDVGKAIHPQNIRGQIEGGVMMGVGYALHEELVVQGGHVVTDTLRKLKVPHIGDAPEIVSLIVEDPHPLGPFTAKGMAELPVAPTAPAITNAIRDAVGVRIRQLPATAQRVQAAREPR